MNEITDEYTFMWRGHKFHACVYDDSTQLNLMSLDMLVGDTKVNMMHFTGQFDDMNEYFCDIIQSLHNAAMDDLRESLNHSH